MDTRPITVVVADDHTGFLKVVSELLEKHFCVLACVTDGDHLIQAATDLFPDVIVSDFDMPGCSGVESLLALRDLGTNKPIVLMGTETKNVVAFLEAGAAAYVHKYDVCADLIEAVRSANAGDTFISRSVRTDGAKPN